MPNESGCSASVHCDILREIRADELSAIQSFLEKNSSQKTSCRGSKFTL